MVQRGEKTCIKRRHQSSAPVWMFAEHVQFYPNSLMSGCFSPSKKDGNIVPKKTESFSTCYTLFRCYYHRWWLKNHPFVGHNTEVGIGKSFQVTRARWILGGFTIKSGCYYHQVIEKDGCLTLQDRSASSIVASFMPCFFLWPLLVGIILVCKRPKQ